MQRKELWIGVGAIALLFIIAFYLDARSKAKPEPEAALEEKVEQVEERVVEDSGVSLDIRNTSYAIGTDIIELVDGVAKRESRTTTLLEGPAFTDLNADGAKDAVVILKDETGGSGIFYHVSVALAMGDSQKTTNSILLGDRVRIKEIAVDKGIISVTILERKDGEPMATAPSVEKILRFTLEGATLVAVK
jgi:hypothetical protein